MRGRPLRFLAMVLGGWTGLRVAMLLPDPATLAKAAADALVPRSQAAANPLPVAVRLSKPIALPASRSPMRVAATSIQRQPDPAGVMLALVGMQSFIEVPSAAGDQGAAAMPAIAARLPVAVAPSRWSGSVFALVRDGVPLASPQLGGSQAGARLAYLVDRGHRIALYGRIAAPLQRGPAELAAGVQWQPTRLPITAYAEARKFGSGPLRPTAGLVGGVTTTLAGAVRLDGYGQVGAIARPRLDGFAEGQARVSHAVREHGPLRFELGAGLWGAAQRGVARLDLGPSLGVTLPVTSRSLRLTLDWRERIAGNARPASGPALTLGTDF